MTSAERTLSASAIALLFSVGVAAAHAGTPYPAQPGPEISISGDGAGFRELFRTLAAQGSVRSRFTESRWFPFRSIPVVLKGEMRFSAKLGLSLRYVQPEERLVIVDDIGLILRDAGGRSREIHPGGQMPNVGGVLMTILRFDEASLFGAFHVRATRLGDAWRADFFPRSAQVARWIGTITVEGRHGLVERIEFRRSSSQRIEIKIDSSSTGVVFGADEQRRYFR